MQPGTPLFNTHLRQLVRRLDMPRGEEANLATLIEVFATLPPPPDSHGLFAHFSRLKSRLITAATGEDAEALEEAFLELYCHIHGHEAPYTPEERNHVNQTGGYWCHAGGLSPILKAGRFIRKSTVSADFGAGNGLQGLLLQKLFPHRKTVQIEVSSRMVAAGMELQKWLGIEADRVQWIVGDVNDHFSEAMSFIYLYRPVKPEGYGIEFYNNLSAKLVSSPQKNLIIFSIADCLRQFLPPEFQVFYTDGHLTCFRRTPHPR